MKGTSERNSFYRNWKVPDPQCRECLWKEWSPKKSTCLNRKRFICSLYVEEKFGNPTPNTIN